MLLNLQSLKDLHPLSLFFALKDGKNNISDPYPISLFWGRTDAQTNIFDIQTHNKIIPGTDGRTDGHTDGRTDRQKN